MRTASSSQHRNKKTGRLRKVTIYYNEANSPYLSYWLEHIGTSRSAKREEARVLCESQAKLQTLAAQLVANKGLPKDMNTISKLGEHLNVQETTQATIDRTAALFDDEP